MKTIMAKLQALLVKVRAGLAKVLPFLKNTVAFIPTIKTKIVALVTFVKNFTPAEMLVVKITAGVLVLIIGSCLLVRVVEWPVKEVKKIEAEHEAKKDAKKTFNLKVETQADEGTESTALDSLNKKLGEKK